MKYSLIILIVIIGICTKAIAQNQTLIDTLKWDNNRKLIWSDFKGTPIDAPGLFGEIFCLMPARYKKDSTSHTVLYEAFTVMDKNASWVSPTKKNVATLKYFQLYFDMFACCALRMRKEYEQLNAFPDPSEMFSKIYDIQMSALAIELKKMKSDTKMGINTLQINNWRIKVNKDLQELATFKNTL